MRSPLTVIAVSTRHDWNQFHAVPGRIQGGDPNWVQPLLMECKALWSSRNPWFGHARAQAFIARRGTQAVGRISAQVDELQAPENGRKIGYFGQFECLNDDAAAEALFAAACAWLEERACKHLRGPYDLGINQACGLLIEGRERPPMVMMGHAPEYYADLLSAQGLVKEMDLLAYLLPPDFEAPRAMRRLLDRTAQRIHFRPMDFGNFNREISSLRDIFNDAWALNWGFVPITEREFTHMGREMRKILKPDYTCIAELDGQAAGFIVALPNLNELIADLNGRLLPTGWMRLLWRLGRGRATSARVPLMGVRRVHQRGPIGAAISFGVIDRVRRALHGDGIGRVEVSWILETNQGMNAMIEAMGGDLYKRYRLYGRALA